MKDMVFPGDMLSDKPIRSSYAYVEDGKSYAMTMGTYDAASGQFVPLEGNWAPRIEDTVIGIISSERNNVYEVDLNFHGRALIIGGRFEKFSFKIGDIVEATIKDIEDKRTIILTYPRQLVGGSVLLVKPSKIPRIIGKNNTMVKQISDSTKSMIAVGKNGMIWLKGGDIALATAAIRRIETEAHVSGLTERIKNMVEKTEKR